MTVDLNLQKKISTLYDYFQHQGKTGPAPAPHQCDESHSNKLLFLSFP